ncbi:TadE family protein [Novosphingobium ginsenosidimutans]
MRMRSLLADTRAVAAAEMALVLPIVSVLFLNVADATTYIYSRMQVDLAAQEAAGLARARCDTAAKLPSTVNCTGLQAAMQTAAQATSLGTSVTINTATAAWYCSNASSELIEVAAISSTPPANCSATLTGSTAEPGEYLSVTASYTFAPLFAGLSVASSLPSPIQRTAWIRMQ